MFEIADPSQLWIVVTGFVISFVLAFGIGANDVANSFGTSVGAKVLTLKEACVLATIFEIAGSMLLGAKVSDTIRKGIIDPTMYTQGDQRDKDLLLIGLVAALGGSCVWLLIATFARVPVSGTHSIVGATVGFSLVAKGLRGVHWDKLGQIVASWFASPVLSAMVSILLFFLVNRFILSKKDPLEYGLRALPFIYGITLVINLYSIFFEGPPLLRFHYIPIWGSFVASFGIGLLCSVIIKFLVVPSLRVQIRKYGENMRRKEQDAELAREKERAQLERDAQNCELAHSSTHDADLALGSSDQAGLLTGDQRKPQRVSFASKIRTRLARIRKRSVPSDVASHTNSKAACREDALADELPVNISRTPSESCSSLATSKSALEPPTSVRNPLISSCSRLPTVVPVSSSTSETDDSTRSTSTSKLDKAPDAAAGPPASNKSSRQDVATPKLGKFRVERIEQDDKHLTTAVRSACTSTTSIFREASKLDAANAALAGNGHSGANEELRQRLVPSDESKAAHCQSVEQPVEEQDATTCCGKKCKKVKGDESREVVDTHESARLFSFLQILTAIFGAFAHGGNDVSNAIGPLIGIWITAEGKASSSSDTPWWILLYGGAGISVGLWVWGRRVIQTLGEDLTKVTPSSGFCIELGAALTVLVASNAKLPVSTTHCKVGSVVGVGRFRSRDNVDWRVFRNIILAWFVTVPASAALGAGLMYALMQLSLIISPLPTDQISNSTLVNSTVSWLAASTDAMITVS